MNVRKSGFEFRFMRGEKRLNIKYANTLRPATDSPAGKDAKYIFVNSVRGGVGTAREPGDCVKLNVRKMSQDTEELVAVACFIL